MKGKRFHTVEMKRRLQKESEQELYRFSKKEQLQLLRRKFRHLVKKRDKAAFS